MLDEHTARLRRELLARKARLEAHDSLLRYIQLQMPDPNNADDPLATRYVTTPLARLLCTIMEKVERGEKGFERVAVSVGPQFGKTAIISQHFPAWASGRNPLAHFISGAYNQDRANEVGGDVRNLIESPIHRSVFPKHELDKSATDALMTTQGGKMAFVGIGGSGTGKPADYFIVDDPIKGDEDAQSAIYRERLWKWYNSVVFSRAHDNTRIVVVHTRWHSDDLIGRLCDPAHPERNKLYAGIARKWLYINLPAVIDDPELAQRLGLELKEQTDDAVIAQFGRKPLTSLWPGRKSLPLLAEAKQQDPRVFNALYMGKPAAEDGEYFKADWIVEYDAQELPSKLTKYGASDHAVSARQRRDFTVLGCVGVDSDGSVWVLPDVVMDRMETDRTVEEIVQQVRMHQPHMWWIEDEMISKSFGPFLKKRMIETSAFTALSPVRPSKDKPTRARAIQGRMSLKQVRFPRFASWWQDAKAQMLGFPYAPNDDFVDWLAHIGMGILHEQGPVKERSVEKVIRVGSPEWILRKAKLDAEREKRAAANEGW